MIWNNKAFVTKTPLVTSLLLEGANVQQLWRMWTERSALGQSFWGWLQVNLALWLWWNYYRATNQKLATWTSALSVVLNGAVVLTVAYFRWIR